MKMFIFRLKFHWSLLEATQKYVFGLDAFESYNDKVNIILEIRINLNSFRSFQIYVRIS